MLNPAGLHIRGLRKNHNKHGMATSGSAPGLGGVTGAGLALAAAARSDQRGGQHQTGQGRRERDLLQASGKALATNHTTATTSGAVPTPAATAVAANSTAHSDRWVRHSSTDIDIERTSSGITHSHEPATPPTHTRDASAALPRRSFPAASEASLSGTAAAEVVAGRLGSLSTSQPSTAHEASVGEQPRHEQRPLEDVGGTKPPPPAGDAAAPGVVQPSDELVHQDLEGKDVVVIHVCDEARGVNRDFPCERATLLREMKYFRAYLVPPDTEEQKCDKDEDMRRPREDVDISVHCDVHIFEWLMKYITYPDDPPSLDTTSVVSILISSDFLEMSKLVEWSLHFMAEHLAEIIKMPIDLSCVSDKLLHQLAELVSTATLASIKDKKDKLLSKLYKRRLELDFRNPSSTSAANSSRTTPGASSGQDNRRAGPMASKICFCSWCGKLFHLAAREVLQCRKAPFTIDFRGEVTAQHVAVEGWSLTEYVSRLHKNGMSWEQIYWLLWGVSHVFQCSNCNEFFTAADHCTCTQHHHKSALSPAAKFAQFLYPNSAALEERLAPQLRNADGNTSTPALAGDHELHSTSAALCCIGPVRRFNYPNQEPMAAAADQTATGDGAEAEVQWWSTVQTLFQKQKKQLLASAQHPAALRETALAEAAAAATTMATAARNNPLVHGTAAGVAVGAATTSGGVGSGLPQRASGASRLWARSAALPLESSGGTGADASTATAAAQQRPRRRSISDADLSKSGDSHSGSDGQGPDKETTPPAQDKRRPSTAGTKSKPRKSSTAPERRKSKSTAATAADKASSSVLNLSAASLESQASSHQVGDLPVWLQSVFHTLPRTRNRTNRHIDGWGILAPSAHPLSHRPPDLLRDEEALRAVKSEQSRRRVAWELDLLHEHDWRRMLALSRQLNQRRAPISSVVGPDTDGQGSGGPKQAGAEPGGAQGSKKKGAGDGDGKRRWR